MDIGPPDAARERQHARHACEAHGIGLRARAGGESHAAPHAILFELKLPLYGSGKITQADAKWEKRDGVPLFVVPIAAEGSAILHFSSTPN